MKKFKIGLLLIIGMFMLPFMVNAEVKPDHEIDEKSNEVKLYIFRGEGCPHCEEALEWLDSIEKEYKSQLNSKESEIGGCNQEEFNRH